MLNTYYSGDLAPLNQAAVADYESQTRRKAVEQAFLVNLLDQLNRGRVGMGEVGARNRATDAQERVGMGNVNARLGETAARSADAAAQLEFLKNKEATDAALRSTELSDRLQMFNAGLADQQAARTAYDAILSKLPASVDPRVAIEQNRDLENRQQQELLSSEVARRANAAGDAAETGAHFWQDGKKLRLKAAQDALNAMDPSISALVFFNPATGKWLPRSFVRPGEGPVSAPPGGVTSNQSAVLRNWLGKPFNPSLLMVR